MGFAVTFVPQHCADELPATEEGLMFEAYQDVVILLQQGTVAFKGDNGEKAAVPIAAVNSWAEENGYLPLYGSDVTWFINDEGEMDSHIVVRPGTCDCGKPHVDKPES